MSILFINLWDITLTFLCPVPGQFDQNCMSYVQISTKSVNHNIGHCQTWLPTFRLACIDVSVYQFLTGFHTETHDIQIFKVLYFVNEQYILL